MGSSGFSWKLADHPKLPKGKTVAVVVLDGWGEATPNEYNCIHKAETPCMDSLKKVHFFALFGSNFYLQISKIYCYFTNGGWVLWKTASPSQHDEPRFEYGRGVHF